MAEGYGGLRHVTGFPDQPPVRSNLSLGDSIAGLHAVMGILAAVYHRDIERAGEGQVVDVAIYEGIFNLMESVVPEYAKYGLVRDRHGSKVTGIVPSNTYPCADGKFIIIGGNGDSIFRRLMVAAGRADLAEDARLARNDGRVRHEAEIDEAISAWTRQHPFEHVVAALDAAGVPAGPIYSVVDQMNDPHFKARGLFEEVSLPDGDTVTIPAPVAAVVGDAWRDDVARSAARRAQPRGVRRTARPERRATRGSEGARGDLAAQRPTTSYQRPRSAKGAGSSATGHSYWSLVTRHSSLLVTGRWSWLTP